MVFFYSVLLAVYAKVGTQYAKTYEVSALEKDQESLRSYLVHPVSYSMGTVGQRGLGEFWPIIRMLLILGWPISLCLNLLIACTFTVAHFYQALDPAGAYEKRLAATRKARELRAANDSPVTRVHQLAATLEDTQRRLNEARCEVERNEAIRRAAEEHELTETLTRISERLADEEAREEFLATHPGIEDRFRALQEKLSQTRAFEPKKSTTLDAPPPFKRTKVRITAEIETPSGGSEDGVDFAEIEIVDSSPIPNPLP